MKLSDDNSTNRLNEIYTTVKHLFKGGVCSIHGLLWDIMINESLTEEGLFHVVTDENGNQLVIALKRGGYNKTGVYFDVSDYDACLSFCYDLNRKVFDFDEDKCNQMLSDSMGLSA
jgi:hypothetical protein